MKNVLVISQTNVFCGAEVVMSDYLKRNKMHKFYVYTSADEEIYEKYRLCLNEEKVFCALEMKMTSFRVNPFKCLMNMIKNLYQIHQIVKMKKIDVLYGNNTVDVPLISLYKRFLNRNIHVISHIHDVIERKSHKYFIGKNERYIDCFITPSKTVKDSLKNCLSNSKKVVVIHNGVSMKEINPNVNICEVKNKFCIPQDKKILCFIGQICTRKRPEKFLQIVNLLNRVEDKYFGIMIGSLIEEKCLSSLKIEDHPNIKYFGEMKREIILSQIYPMIDALILTSDRDPLPTVILEAMSLGKLVVARDVDGVSEIIENGINGIKFPYDCEPEKIINEIRLNDVFQDEVKWKTICCNAKKTICCKFSPEIKEMKINKIISELGDKDKGGSYS